MKNHVHVVAVNRRIGTGPGRESPMRREVQARTRWNNSGLITLCDLLDIYEEDTVSETGL